MKHRRIAAARIDGIRRCDRRRRAVRPRAAIRLKQLNADLTVVVVEKGSEVAPTSCLGAVIDPVSLDKLIPDWRADADCPLKTQVRSTSSTG